MEIIWILQLRVPLNGWISFNWFVVRSQIYSPIETVSSLVKAIQFCGFVGFYDTS